jgi:membrane-bound lytic murein transglycosylase A
MTTSHVSRIRKGASPLLSILMLSALALPACVGPPPEISPAPLPVAKDYARPLPPGASALRKVTASPRFRDDRGDRESLKTSVSKSLAYLDKPSSRRFFPVEGITHEHARRSLLRFAELLDTVSSPTELEQRLLAEYDVYMSVGCDNQGTVLFTGYCQPVYTASRQRTATHRYPLYRLPPDLVKDEDGSCLGRRLPDGRIEPGYPTRRQIEEGNLLAGQELVWLKDRLEVYIVHVQGSARLELTDGSEMSVGYAGRTDHPYRSIGAELIKDGKLSRDNGSLTGIKEYFRKNPQDLDRYLYRNDRFIFFTQCEGGPYGSLGQEVTAFRSIATDKSIFPRASLCFASTRVPELTERGVIQRPLDRFVLDQDTGGAIRSPGRCDLFLGTGDDAERVAGFTYAEGKLYYLFLKSPPPSLERVSP